MTQTKLVTIVSIAAIVLGAIVTYVTCNIRYNNAAVTLINKAEAQQKVIQTSHDEMIKILAQQAQVTTEYKDAVDSVFTHIVSERYSKGDGSLMKWITEDNPNFDPSLYKELEANIESLRKEFKTAQDRMIDISREHKTLCSTFPGSFFINDDNKKEIEVKLILSTRTNEAVRTGVDDNINLF